MPASMSLRVSSVSLRRSTCDGFTDYFVALSMTALIAHNNAQSVLSPVATHVKVSQLCLLRLATIPSSRIVALTCHRDVF